MKLPHTLLVLSAALSVAASAGIAQDLNANFTADSAERRAGAPDCNHNGFLDAVDVARPHFTTGVEHQNGDPTSFGSTSDVATLDFDSDGDLDLVAVGSGSSGQGVVALWRNDGGIGLTWLTNLVDPSWSGLWSVSTGDINGDGRADLALSDGGAARVHVVLATGPGTFGASVTLSGSASTQGMMRIALGDLDRDGDLDLVAPTVAANLIDIWTNNGSGALGNRRSFATGVAPSAVAIGDFTGDGLADIAVSNRVLAVNSAGTVTLLRNTGPSFAPLSVITLPSASGPSGVMFPHPVDLCLIDHDHDGDLDLAVSSEGSEQLDLFANAGNGAFALSSTVGRGDSVDSRAARVLATDLDADGWLDLAWGDSDAHSASIFLNRRDGTFRFHQSFAMGNFAGKGLAAADFDRDGILDLVSANDTTQTFSIARGTGAGRFDAPLRIRPAQNPVNTVLQDFNRDGLTDFGFVLQGQSGVLGFGVYLGTGHGAMAQTPIISPLVFGGTIVARDVNHDSIVDLVEVVGRCNVYLGRGDGSFQPGIVNPAPVFFLHVIVDVNGDGHLDIVWSRSFELVRSLGDGTGHFQAPQVVGEALLEVESIAAGDLNGDGAPEVFTGHRRGGLIRIFSNAGDGTFAQSADRAILASPLNPVIAALACADFDRDGDNDIVASAAGIFPASGLRLYRNPGNGSLPSTPEVVNQSAINPFSTASFLILADINQDGAPDLYGRGGAGIAYINDGTGTFSAMFLPGYDSNARFMRVGDINNDGRPDVLFEHENTFDKYAFLNLPPSSADLNSNLIPDECEALPCPADFNTDGTLNPDDLADYINCYFAAPACPQADFNADTDTNGDDLADYINAYFAGCP